MSSDPAKRPASVARHHPRRAADGREHRRGGAGDGEFRAWRPAPRRARATAGRTARRRPAASGAVHVIDDARVFSTAAEAIADLSFVYATTARSRDLPKQVVGPREAIAQLRSRTAQGQATGIFFGRERWGLTNEEVALADAIVTFPVNPKFASLNIAQAVLLMSYEWMAAGLAGALTTRGAVPAIDLTPASKAHLIGLMEHLEGALAPTGYFRTDDMKPTMVQNLRAILQRAGLTRDEIDVLHGVVAALEGRHEKRDRDAGDG